MRAIVAQHDRVAGINEFDLNKPPQQPYKYEAYPKMVYTVVKDRQEFEKKLSEGWKEAPATAAEPLQKDVSAPKMMYAVVADKEQLDKKSKEGGKEIPPGLPAANPGPGSHYSGLDPATAAEAEAADRKLHEKPKGK